MPVERGETRCVNAAARHCDRRALRALHVTQSMKLVRSRSIDAQPVDFIARMTPCREITEERDNRIKADVKHHADGDKRVRSNYRRRVSRFTVSEIEACRRGGILKQAMS